MAARVRRLLRRYERELVCGRCRNVIAQVAVGLFTGPRLLSPHAFEILPVGGWALHQAHQRLTSLRTAEVADEVRQFHDDEVSQAQRRLAYLEAHAGEIYYELPCADCAASYLRSAPALLADVRRADSGRVILGRQGQDIA